MAYLHGRPLAVQAGDLRRPGVRVGHQEPALVPLGGQPPHPPDHHVLGHRPGLAVLHPLEHLAHALPDRVVEQVAVVRGGLDPHVGLDADDVGEPVELAEPGQFGPPEPRSATSRQHRPIWCLARPWPRPRIRRPMFPRETLSTRIAEAARMLSVLSRLGRRHPAQTVSTHETAGPRSMAAPFALDENRARPALTYSSVRAGAASCSRPREDFGGKLGIAQPKYGGCHRAAGIAITSAPGKDPFPFKGTSGRS